MRGNFHKCCFLDRIALPNVESAKSRHKVKLVKLNNRKRSEVNAASWRISEGIISLISRVFDIQCAGEVFAEQRYNHECTVSAALIL